MLCGYGTVPYLDRYLPTYLPTYFITILAENQLLIPPVADVADHADSTLLGVFLNAQADRERLHGSTSTPLGCSFTLRRFAIHSDAFAGLISGRGRGLG